MNEQSKTSSSTQTATAECNCHDGERRRTPTLQVVLNTLSILSYVFLAWLYFEYTQFNDEVIRYQIVRDNVINRIEQQEALHTYAEKHDHVRQRED